MSDGLTIREKFRATALHQRVGLPHFEAGGFWDETVERWHGEGLPRDMTPWEYFHLDRFMDNAPTVIRYHTDRPITPPYWPAFDLRTIEETDDYIVSRQDDGIVSKRLKQGTSIPQFIQYPVLSERDWQEVKVRLDPAMEERYSGLEEVAIEVRNRGTVLRFGICGAYGTLRNLFGPENLCYALYDHPALIHRILGHWVTFTCAIADRFCAAIDFDYVFLWEDMAFKTGPLLSPSHFRQFILPYYRELVGHLRDQHGFDLFMVDSDGNDWDILPLFIEAGVNMFTPLEIAAGMEPLQIRERFPELALLGGIDKRSLLHGKDGIEREIERKVPALLAQGGYFPSIDHHVPADVSFDSFCTFVELLREAEGE